ncbi:MAG: DUF4238 domain-containing protein, partial [Rhodothermales bacterium]|nr:DUF4238 domain-containing protein [Rhodothermales bacterium]
MAEKKKQHIIPECYLKSFVDDTPPAGVSMELYEPAVWITDKSLKEASRRRAPNNVLWKNRYYNLEADNPSRPRIEEELAWLEGRYAKVLEALRRRHELSVRQAIEIALFVAVLFGRTNSFISNMQNQIDEIEHLYRQVDRAYNENESVSDEYWEGSSDGGKLSLILTGPALAQRLLSFGITVVVNESGVP